MFEDQQNSQSTVVESPFLGKSFADTIFKVTLIGLGAGVPIYMLYLYLVSLINHSTYSVNYFGWSIFTNTRWNVVYNTFGITSFVYGTITTSLIGIIIALPVSILAGVFIYEYIPVKYKDTVRGVIDLLAGIPSVLYGLWGIFVLIPLLKVTILPPIHQITGFDVSGYSYFTAGIILAIMITPILVNIIMEGFDTVPLTLREAMFGMGATRWEVSRYVTVGTTKPTIFVALMLGLGRALGETLAVTMVIGSNNNPPSSWFNIFTSGQSMTSLLVNEFGEATSRLYISALFEVALVLFIITTIFNTIGMLILKRMKRE